MPGEEEGDTEGLVSPYHTIDNLKEKKREWAEQTIRVKKSFFFQEGLVYREPSTQTPKINIYCAFRWYFKGRDSSQLSVHCQLFGRDVLQAELFRTQVKRPFFPESSSNHADSFMVFSYASCLILVKKAFEIRCLMIFFLYSFTPVVGVDTS